MLLLRNQNPVDGLNGGDADEIAFAGGRKTAAAPASLDIGLVNNMPDAALRATERQFIALLGAATGDTVVRLHFFALPEIPRGAAELPRIRAAYADIRDLPSIELDALIVTGCEPRADRLSDEPYWKRLAEVIDWAEHNTVSTIWSCLAAHAAVLHLDGIERRRLPEKRSGLYDCRAAGANDPLVSGMRTPVVVAHSRWNDLAEDELAGHGYQVLTRSEVAGVDAFSKRWRSLFVFLQGHPEYSTEALMREYRRDVGRFLRSESDNYPAIPFRYFASGMESELAAFRADAMGDRDPVLLERFPSEVRLRAALLHGTPRPSPLIGNWLAYLAANKARAASDAR